ncbi:hypothetical protein [Sphingomonas corticis]|jgi:hypothetical protein|uniref:Uncharacterized protein n=1 Tax=Sphingomonas corticis TaxID=2722791 RepID=A0ABX1CK22_9SPHN|nr:hypothetical protein [Sphingomonas corticis]NJR78342.1 hypothetical protein [Sphingomonas corticis]
MNDNDRPPPRPRPARVALVIAVIAAMIWGTFMIGQILSGHEQLRKDPHPGQQQPAPKEPPARQPQG